MSAKEKFEKVLELREGDKPTILLLNYMKEMDYQPPHDW